LTDVLLLLLLVPSSTLWTLLLCVYTTERTVLRGMEVIERTVPADNTERYHPKVMLYFKGYILLTNDHGRE
jgi:hypothetical protein